MLLLLPDRALPAAAGEFEEEEDRRNFGFMFATSDRFNFVAASVEGTPAPYLSSHPNPSCRYPTPPPTSLCRRQGKPEREGTPIVATEGTRTRKTDRGHDPTILTVGRI
ncbi:unnamed protein product [Linum trigynum]|uniref:Secreted protein n=1 Tax=Linum trigynum TaxID=586398 RepID=A0AAV2G6B4_9ROSI